MNKTNDNGNRPALLSCAENEWSKTTVVTEEWERIGHIFRKHPPGHSIVLCLQGKKLTRDTPTSHGLENPQKAEGKEQVGGVGRHNGQLCLGRRGELRSTR